MCFENKIIRGIYATQYVASWVKTGGQLGGHIYIKGKLYSDIQLFRQWLETLIINDGKLTEDEIRIIINLADDGKLELEESAKRFIKEL